MNDSIPGTRAASTRPGEHPHVQHAREWLALWPGEQAAARLPQDQAAALAAQMHAAAGLLSHYVATAERTGIVPGGCEATMRNMFLHAIAWCREHGGPAARGQERFYRRMAGRLGVDLPPEAGHDL